MTPPLSPEPGKTHWRSLADLANTPEFRAFAAEEFPGFANVYESLGEAELKGDENPETGLSRRKGEYSQNDRPIEGESESGSRPRRY